MLAGSTQEVGHILREHVAESDGRSQATVFGPAPFRTGAASAALVNGTSGHALDWDDTQLATSADRIFGLLTHPTVPPLVAALAVGEPRHVSGSQFLEAFLTGFEVECKIAEAIHPNHYKKGFHSSGTDRHVRRHGRRGEAAGPRARTPWHTRSPSRPAWRPASA